VSTEPESLKNAWQAHHEAMRTIREHLAKEGATIQVDIIIRDKAASERYAKRIARKRR
jgi:hypothetical protein